jgi:UDP-N-acetylmuramyl pentapeptide phosphotransferase/UDP-N-acetylglucosamine-1-phosphate transferase
LPQRFHVGHIPRLGGLAMFSSLVLTVGVAGVQNWWGYYGNALHWNQWVLYFFMAMLPAVAGGIAEDMTQRMTVRYRLILTLLTGLLAVYLLGMTVPRMGLVWMDAALSAAPWLGMALAVLAIAGLPHAFNIIDGYNGLAGMVAVIICAALTHVALQLGDRELAAILVITAAATLGFMFWNYPMGQLFAGDGGAYVWGIVIAFCSITLVQRHPIVSPWFPMLLLIYPVWETMFSIYRKLARGDSPGMADALHLHQLIYRRIVRSVLDENAARRMLRRNNRTAPYLWAFTLLTVVPAVLFWRNTYILIGFCALFCVSYVAAYLVIVRFKLPGWIR